jgi:hypothetical protein
MFKNLSDEERKFVYFWMIVFSSALAFWVVIVRWLWGAIATLIA